MFAVQVADSIITKVGLDAGALEANSVLSYLAHQNWFLILKPIIALVLVLVLAKRISGDDRAYKTAAICLLVLNIGYTGLLVWGVHVLGVML